MRAVPYSTPSRQSHAIQTLPAPSYGLDFSTPVAEMDPRACVECDNLIASDNGLAVRKGWYDFAENINGGAEVKTVMGYGAATPSALAIPSLGGKLFAATDNGIYDITAGGDFTAAAPVMALSGTVGAGRFSYAEFTTDGGKYLVACSEIDGGFLYDGTSWMKMTSAGGPGPGIITGVDPADFVQVIAWKRRLMFVERASTSMWVLDVVSVGGAAVDFNFGPIMQRGGTLLALMNWTQDAGDGIDDRLIVLGSNGDLAVYTGTDPTDATKFAMEGVWYIGQPPIGRRCFTQAGGSPFVLTQFGMIPVAQIMQGGLDNVLTSDTMLLQRLRQMQEQFRRDFDTTLTTVGWEVLHVPPEALLIVKRPTTSANNFIQYAFQMHTMSWSRLLDIPINTLSVWLNQVYAGTSDGKVLRVFDGYTDGETLAGGDEYEIRARLTPAFNYFGAPDRNKHAVMARCSFLAASPPEYALRMNTNFSVESTSETPALAGLAGSLWDSSFWDSAIWSGGRAGYAEWRSVSGLGYALAPTIFISANTRTVLTSISYMLKPGGPF